MCLSAIHNGVYVDRHPVRRIIQLKRVHLTFTFSYTFSVILEFFIYATGVKLNHGILKLRYNLEKEIVTKTYTDEADSFLTCFSQKDQGHQENLSHRIN